jgi:hypothetical protein
MKSVYVSAAAIALTAAVNLSPALAQGPTAFGREGSQPLTTPPRLPSRQRGITNTDTAMTSTPAGEVTGFSSGNRRPAQTKRVRVSASDKCSIAGFGK